MTDSELKKTYFALKLNIGDFTSRHAVAANSGRESTKLILRDLKMEYNLPENFLQIIAFLHEVTIVSSREK